MGIYHQNIYREQAQPVRYAGTTLSLYGLLGVDYFEYQQLGRAIPLERILNDVSITGMNISEPFTHNAEYLPTSDLRTTKTVAGDYFSGGTVTYTITYGNSGFDTDTITITDTLSETWLSGINYTDTRTYNGNGEFET